MSPTRYRFSTPHYNSGEPGFEPGQTESKSGVLPLDDSPMYGKCNCWGRDSNPQAIRHTHLKRTCIPVPSPQHEICCECNIPIFYEKSILNKIFWLCLFFLIQLIKINQIFIHIIYYEYSNYLFLHIGFDSIPSSMWNQNFQKIKYPR